MRRSNWTPSIVPRGDDQNVHIVQDDFGANAQAYRETDVEAADLEKTITDLLDRILQKSGRIVVFNTAEKWSKDGPEDVAHPIRGRCDLQLCDVPASLHDFVEGHDRASSLTAWCER